MHFSSVKDKLQCIWLC